MPNMADPLKCDQIYLHFKHILNDIVHSKFKSKELSEG